MLGARIEGTDGGCGESRTTIPDRPWIKTWAIRCGQLSEIIERLPADLAERAAALQSVLASAVLLPQLAAVGRTRQAANRSGRTAGCQNEPEPARQSNPEHDPNGKEEERRQKEFEALADQGKIAEAEVVRTAPSLASVGSPCDHKSIWPLGKLE